MSLIVFKEQSAHGNVGSGINHCFPSRQTSDQCGSFVCLFSQLICFIFIYFLIVLSLNFCSGKTTWLSWGAKPICLGLRKNKDFGSEQASSGAKTHFLTISMNPWITLTNHGFDKTAVFAIPREWALYLVFVIPVVFTFVHYKKLGQVLKGLWNFWSVPN